MSETNDTKKARELTEDNRALRRSDGVPELDAVSGGQRHSYNLAGRGRSRLLNRANLAAGRQDCRFARGCQGGAKLQSGLWLRSQQGHFVSRLHLGTSITSLPSPGRANHQSKPSYRM
jgi:hypothetical protein